MNPYCFFIWTTARAFQTTVLIDVAYAAPRIPDFPSEMKSGIKVRFY